MNLAITLAQLENEQLVRAFEDAYLFKHALTQETAYQSLLRQSRRDIHRVVAETYETLFADQLDDYAAILARHYAETDETGKVIEYETRAGDAAARVHAPLLALEHFAHALELVTRNGAAAMVAPTDLFLKKGRMLELAGRFEDALANYAAMETRARESKDRAMELAALIAQATIRSSTSAVRDEEKAKQVSAAALTLARDLKDEAAQAKILWNLSLMHSFSGHPRESVEYGEQSIAIARKMKLREQLAYSLNDISFGYMTLGQKENARTSLQDAREIWRALDNKSMLGDNLARAAMLGFLYGDLAASQADATELVEISTRINNLWGLAEATGHQGGLLLEYGEPIEAIRELKASIEYGEQVGHVGAIIAGQLWLAGLYLQLGAVERGIENAEQAEAKAKDSITSWQFWARAILAQSFLLKGKFVQADELANQAYATVPREDFLAFPYAAIAASQTACAIKNYARALDRADQLIAFLDQSGFQAFRADANHARAMAFLGQGDYDQARAALEQARAEAERQNSRRMLWKILAARAECESNQAKAREWRAKSRGVVEYIAAHSPADLRGHFLNLPEVERVMRLA